MTARLGTALLGASLLIAGCADGSSSSFQSAALDTNDQKASYGIGLNVGGQIVDTKERLDMPAFMRGIDDALQGRDPTIDRGELQTVLQQFGEEMQAAAAERASREAEENTTAGQAYLAENGAREGVTTTESGLQYEVLHQGDGAMPTAQQSVRLHYKGSLIDGTEFDSSYDGEPVVFGVSRLIPGFTEALLLMPVGSHYRIAIPAGIAYGERGSPPAIGPNATLIFEIEVFEIVE